MEEYRSKTDEEQFFKEKGFGMNIGFGKRPALVIIDLTPAFTDYKNPRMLLASNLESQIAANNRLLEAAHSRKIPVIFTRVAYDDDNFRDAGAWALKQKGLETLKAGTTGVEIDPALDYQEGDMILTKKYASAFFGTDLTSRLVSQGVDTVILTGCSTSGCVRASAVDGISSGFRPIVVREAVGDRSQMAHEQSLFDLQAKYAEVVSIEEVLEYFDKIEPAV
ncbi:MULTISPECIES: isochorismatase family protein [unclassified Paenibacillus]|uniref:isochorismatase family protein n=1 Tax=unclassified Paenibacillus TaxID=185978 RepID=UPI001AE41EE3|nr:MULTISPECIES: isochorismatase family protein [unclassified Paenibacillus]MBP1154944.1 nicotinamidase-related amidase [Paenibacillus sp. PvP091]MBP1169672.1 nicotinamidase-related amidase [Paenibacillus sp. PvR098]MBP2440700.1 nicotinamidase-related amidase [Paenibacillus sp. PvP052]